MNNPFDGHRVYNGCPDSTLQKRLDEIEKSERRMKELDPELSCVYFPSPGYYQIWKGYKPFDGWDPEVTFPNRADAIHHALGKLEA